MRSQFLTLLLLAAFVLIATTCSAPAAAVAPPTTVPPTPTAVPPSPTPDSGAPVNAWVTAINRGDVDGALAFFDDKLSFMVYGQTAADKDQLRQILDGQAGLETKYRITECQPQEHIVVCTTRLVDACLAASGATDGLQMNLVFTVGTDGQIQKLVGAMSGLEWNDYLTQFVYPWLRWIEANRIEEVKKADAATDRREAGAIMAKLCRAYAKSLMGTQAES